MNKTSEILAPAGNMKNGLVALYSGADAVYLAYKEFGARAYADNFSLDEIKNICSIAHAMNKNIYVVVNTSLKENELASAYQLVDNLINSYVDAIITTDPAIINYLSKVCPKKLHISTQVGVKNLNDALFFSSIGASRVVLARETSIDTIKEIKENSNIEVEAFIHGALCVSYSGGCLLSSMLSLRSGNRGRCAQNCRREYSLYEDGKLIADKEYLLSMKDLSSENNLSSLTKLKVDSLKIEGRMKNAEYVKNVVSYYKDLRDNHTADKTLIESIFHRKFTSGFLAKTDRGSVCDIKSPSNEGLLVGKVVSIKNDTVTMKVNKTLNIGDRIKFNGENPQYLTIDNLTNEYGEEIKNGVGILKTSIDFKLKNNGEIIKMIDSTIDVEINSNVIPLTISVTGSLGNKLLVNVNKDDDFETITFESESELVESSTKPLTSDSIYNQLSKLNDTPFYIPSSSFYCYLDGSLFLPVKELNEIRRKIVSYYYDLANKSRYQEVNKFVNTNSYNSACSDLEVIATCQTEEQYNLLKNLGINKIYYNNRSTFTDSKYKDIDDSEVLVGNYGGLLKYQDKEITTDYSFNIMNSDSANFLFSLNVKHVCLSYEISKMELKDIYDGFIDKYKAKPNFDFIVYGRQNLMTLEYCPLRQFGKCGSCNNHKYELKDNFGSFHIMHEDCKTHLLNGDTTNLLPELSNIIPYVSRIRLDFTNEDETEIKEVISDLYDSLKGKKVSLKPHQTRGYFLRPIL